MGTVRYRTHHLYLLIDRNGSARVRRRWSGRPPDEYVFRLVVRVPYVERPAIEADLVVELPPEIDPDGTPSAELAGPLEEQ